METIQDNISQDSMCPTPKKGVRKTALEKYQERQIERDEEKKVPQKKLEILATAPQTAEKQTKQAGIHQEEKSATC